MPYDDPNSYPRREERPAPSNPPPPPKGEDSNWFIDFIRSLLGKYGADNPKNRGEKKQEPQVDAYIAPEYGANNKQLAMRRQDLADRMGLPRV